MLQPLVDKKNDEGFVQSTVQSAIVWRYQLARSHKHDVVLCDYELYNRSAAEVRLILVL